MADTRFKWLSQGSFEVEFENLFKKEYPRGRRKTHAGGGDFLDSLRVSQDSRSGL
jgi:hypothetical protein